MNKQLPFVKRPVLGEAIRAAALAAEKCGSELPTPVRTKLRFLPCTSRLPRLAILWMRCCAEIPQTLVIIVGLNSERVGLPSQIPGGWAVVVDSERTLKTRWL